MQRLKILCRMLRNRLLASDPILRSEQPVRLHRLAFVLNFFPPYNLACWLWIKLFAQRGGESGMASAISWALMRQGLLFGALRHLSPEDRTTFARAMIVPVLRQQAGPARFGEATRASADQLTRDGFVGLGSVVSSKEADAAVDFFRHQQGYASQTPLQSDGVLRSFDDDILQKGIFGRYFCFSSGTSLACPQVAMLTRHPMLREVAAAYLGFTPTLYSVNTIATNKGQSDHYVMRMHRDYDAFASLTFFVCWTSVAPNNGATIYLRGSHLSSKVDDSAKTYLSGQAGEVFAVDTFGLHSGNRDVTGLRLTTWIRFSSVPNLGTIQDPDLVPSAKYA